MKNKERTKGKIEGSSGLDNGVSQKEDTYGIEEPWLSIETKLIAGSLIIGMVALVLLATLVNIFLLKG